MSSASDPRVTSTHGHAPDAEGPAPGPVDPATGQHTSYWILTEKERAKGFVRPVRTKYRHVGKRPLHSTRPLNEGELDSGLGDEFALFEAYPDGGRSSGRFWTNAELSSGCGSYTSMGTAIAETYARQPSFYGSTFCCSCGKHLPVDEFTWADSPGERVGT